MSMKRCIPEMLNDGRINQRQAEQMRSLYDDLERDYASKFGQQAAEAMASEETVRRLEADALNKKRQVALQVKAQQRIADDVRKFKGDDPGAAAIALFTHDSKAPYSNIERRADAIEGQAHALMNGILEKHSRNALGQVRNRATLMNVVREAFGEHTGDHEAKELADAWGQSSEMLRTRFNAAGGSIGKMENWGMPQIHNTLAVRAATFEQWRAFIAPLLDREKMQDAGGLPISPQALELALRSAYDKIRTDGWNVRKAGVQTGSGKLANRHTDSRFMIFKDADSWMAYQREYGRPLSATANSIDPDGPIFDAMMGHVRSMSNEIAQMQVLGPNPAASVRWIKDGLMIEAQNHSGTKRIDQADAAQHKIDALYGELSGGNRGIDNRLKAVFGAVRSWQSASKLGKAVFSAVTDVGFQHVTRRFNGIPAANALNGYVRLLKPGSAADRALSTRLWMISEEASRLMVSQSRWTGEVMTGELAARLSEGVQRVSGLSAWTQAGRWAFGQEFWSHITDQSNKNWDNINKPFRKALERYGFSPADWDAIRSTPHEEVNGSHWLLPENIRDPAHAERLAEMVATEMDYAVPTASIRVSSAINSSLKRGTWMGEVVRSALLFKSFPITVMLMHGKRMVEQESFDKLKYAAALGISTTLMGALAMQLKALSAGKDPIDPTATDKISIMGKEQDVHTFWLKAMAQGGGLGIFGDFLNSTTSRFSNDIYSTLGGPVLSTVSDAINVAKSKSKARGLERLIASNTPGSSLWYTQLALQREMLDQMQKQIDPQAPDAFSKMEKRARQGHTDYWWRPGETAPDRAPSLAH